MSECCNIRMMHGTTGQLPSGLLVCSMQKREWSATVVGKDVCSGIEMQTINKLIIRVPQVLPLYKCHRQICSGSSVL